MGRDSRESAPELRCVAPLAVLGKGAPELVGPCILVTNGSHVIAVSSSELLRQAGEPLAILTRLDGSTSIAVTAWSMVRQHGIGIVELGPTQQFTTEVHPLHLSAVCATVDTRGAPSALVTMRFAGGRFVREVISVHVDAIDGWGAAGVMTDDIITRLASPAEPHPAEIVDGAPLFSWMPADPVLGRRSEIVLVALGIAYRARTFKPRAQPAIAELVGLEDLGRALPWAEHTPPPSNELVQIAGEIGDALADHDQEE